MVALVGLTGSGRGSASEHFPTHLQVEDFVFHSHFAVEEDVVDNAAALRLTVLRGGVLGCASTLCDGFVRATKYA